MRTLLKILVGVTSLLLVSPVVKAQTANTVEETSVVANIQRPKRPDTYHQVDSVRNALQLDHNQFEKIHAAYEKYNNAVFGEQRGRREGRPEAGQRGMGRERRGNGGGQGVRPGRHGGGRNPGMMRSGESKSNNKKMDPQKFEELKTKQEEALEKSMKKILKNNDELFKHWQQIREGQLAEMFPQNQK